MVTEGIVNLNKPKNMTSHQCVQEIRRITGIRRVGHTGTLDPQTDGVLPVCVGNAARVVEYLDLDYKKYRCEMTLGLVTDTQDVWGKVVSDTRRGLAAKGEIGSNRLRKTLDSFVGLIEQAPPKYSAVKVGGRRLYEYARAGEPVEIKKRKVFVKGISVINVDMDEYRATFDITCSKGTYVRAVCNDAGALLGCGGAMSSLTRLASGAFTLDDAISLEDLKKMGTEDFGSVFKPVDYPLVHFGRMEIRGEETISRFVNGGFVDLREVIIESMPEFALSDPPFPFRADFKKAYNVYYAFALEKAFLGVAFLDEERGKLKADKVFFRGAGR